MRIRHTTTGATEKVEQQMTPMIDVVFQLIAFFLFSFTISSVEGNFNVKMPLGASQGAADTPTEVISVRLTAGPDGKLAGIKMGDRPLSSFRALHEEIMAIVGVDAPEAVSDNTEVEIDADYNLEYRYIIDAITAISGYINSQGEAIKLIDKIKFAPPRAPM